MIVLGIVAGLLCASLLDERRRHALRQRIERYDDALARRRLLRELERHDARGRSWE